MTRDSEKFSLLSVAPRLSKLTAVYFLFYVFIMNMIVMGYNIPSVLMSDVGMAVTGCISILMMLSVLSFVIASFSEPRASALRVYARCFLWIGTAMLVTAIPRCIVGEGTEVVQVGEKQYVEANYLEGLSELQFGDITLETKGYNILLSRRVDIKTTVSTLTGDKEYNIGLYPATRIGPWRFTINKFGYAPFVDWQDEDGNQVIKNWVMLGTFPRMAMDVDIVDWIPVINLMLGVGYYPPARDDIITIGTSPYRVYIRIEEATINGVVHDMRDPDAHVFLTDGKLENPKYYVKIFKDNEVVYEKRLEPGEMAVFPGGQLRLSSNIMLWVELQAQKNSWLAYVKAGFYSLFIALLMSLALFVVRMAGFLKKVARSSSLDKANKQ